MILTYIIFLRFIGASIAQLCNNNKTFVHSWERTSIEDVLRKQLFVRRYSNMWKMDLNQFWDCLLQCMVDSQCFGLSHFSNQCWHYRNTTVSNYLTPVADTSRVLFWQPRLDYLPPINVSVCQTGLNPQTWSCYWVVPDIEKNFTVARNLCMLNSGHAANVKTSNTFEFLNESGLLDTYGRTFIGLTASQTNENPGTFRWMDGDQLSWAQWANYQPDGNEYCAYVSTEGFADIACVHNEVEPANVLCEKETHL